MAAKSLWDQIEQRQQGILSSIYYLDDHKTCCQDYTQKHDKIELFDIYRRTTTSDDVNLAAEYVHEWYLLSILKEWIKCNKCDTLM